jgi:hypothetical protein
MQSLSPQQAVTQRLPHFLPFWQVKLQLAPSHVGVPPLGATHTSQLGPQRTATGSSHIEPAVPSRLPSPVDGNGWAETQASASNTGSARARWFDTTSRHITGTTPYSNQLHDMRSQLHDSLN